MSLIYMAPAMESPAAVGTETQPRRRRNRLYLAGKADAKNRDKLLRWGITHILNTTPSKDASIQVGFYRDAQLSLYLWNDPDVPCFCRLLISPFAVCWHLLRDAFNLSLTQHMIIICIPWTSLDYKGGCSELLWKVRFFCLQTYSSLWRGHVQFVGVCRRNCQLYWNGSLPWKCLGAL